MFRKIIQIWKTPDLRKSIMFVIALLIVFRVAAHIPIPGVNLEALREFFNSNQILGLAVAAHQNPWLAFTLI